MHHGDVSPQIARGLLALKTRIAAAKIPPSKLDETINVAVWNIREFGNVRRRKPPFTTSRKFWANSICRSRRIAVRSYGSLSCAAYSGAELGRGIFRLAERWWWNKERTAFLFDRRAVTFNGLAAEVDALRSKKGTEYLAAQSFWRAPYMCSFRAGNFDFIVIATHTRWGSSIEGRQAELQMLADWVDTRFKGRFVEDHDLIVMGDFNVPKIGDNLFKALTSCGLQVPDTLVNLEQESSYWRVESRQGRRVRSDPAPSHIEEAFQ